MHYDSQNIPSFSPYIFLMTILNSNILQNNRSSMTQHAGKKVITSMRRKGLFFPQSNLRCKSVSMAFQSFLPSVASFSSLSVSRINFASILHHYTVQWKVFKQILILNILMYSSKFNSV